MAKLNALPQGSWVLVTGANGYIGSHVANAILEQGYRVRGTVRSDKPWLDEFFQGKFGKDKYESIILTEFENEDVLLKALDGVSGLAHVASDVSFSKDPNQVIPWVVKATETLLATAAKVPTLKRVVLTSSSSAALIPKTNETGVRVNEDTWNEKAIKAAWDPNTPDNAKGYNTYAASKTEGERAAWKWVEKNKPPFAFSAVLPNCTWGEVLHPEIYGSTMGWVRDIVKGDPTNFQLYIPQHYVDVGDIARLHAVALLGEGIENERIFGFAGEANKSDVFKILKELRPDNNLIPEPDENEGRDLSEVLPAKKAEQWLKEYYGQSGWVDLKTSLAAGIRDL
ncbi:Aldehyde reductase 2 [Colletotrichum spinosum]|uniref:Aldehyde reductase 2 n=1 Tax=Colletotrichum spinosum TaxID=1347390 RepID=A0A4R8QMW5_9PEZI|nr:Aldehyde reductase 2 [Colletotrichum spinosum]